MQKKLENSFFWDIQSEPILESKYSHFDGASWELEATFPSLNEDFKTNVYKYHRVSISNPDQECYLDACLSMIKLCDPEFGLRAFR